MKRTFAHYPLYIFLIFYIALALTTYKTFPIANGEEYRILRGKETLDHFFSGEFKEKLLQPVPNYFMYNLYPMVMILLNPNFYYEWFHLFNLLFASVGFIATYALAVRMSNRVWIRSAVLIALLLSPRFFGELGINPVDMPFMVFYLLSILAILKFGRHSTEHWSTLLLGILFGITQGLRQIGFGVYILLIISDLYDRYSGQEFALKTRLLKYIYIFIIANFFMLITWPNFAINFFSNYAWYLFIGSKFYLWDFGLLFFGNFLTNDQRPWFYLPFFQLITYPIYILMLFLPTAFFFKKLIKNKTYFILSVVLIFNYFLYLVLKPVLYDGIRHFLFLVPIIVLLAITNLELILSALKNKFTKVAIFFLIAINLLALVAYTLKEYPYHYPYFNKIAFIFGNPYKLFESDYSNTKYREASEWIRDEYLKDESVYSHSDLKSMLKVYACDNAFALDYFSHKKFLSVIQKEKANLIVCDYRNLKQSGYEGEIIKEFYLNGYDVLYVMKLK